jgi:hypothetical protein
MIFYASRGNPVSIGEVQGLLHTLHCHLQRLIFGGFLMFRTWDDQKYQQRAVS